MFLFFVFFCHGEHKKKTNKNKSLNSCKVDFQMCRKRVQSIVATILLWCLQCGGHVGNFRAEFTWKKKTRTAAGRQLQMCQELIIAQHRSVNSAQPFSVLFCPHVNSTRFQRAKVFLPPIIPRSVQKPKRYFRFRRSGGKFEFTSCVWLCPNFQLWKFVHNWRRCWIVTLFIIIRG